MRQCLATRNTLSSPSALRWRFAPHRFLSTNASTTPPPPPPGGSNSSSTNNNHDASSSSKPKSPLDDADEPEARNVPEGELNQHGYYQSRAELTHVWDGNPGGFNRGQALYYGHVARQRFHQFTAQLNFQNKWLRRLSRLFLFSLVLSGAINMYLVEGENAEFPYSGESATHIRIAAHAMKSNPAVLAALGPFIIDYPESLFVSQFRNGRAGLMFAVIGTRARGIVTIELARKSRLSTEWRVADFTVDLLDGTSIEVVPIGTVFSSKSHKERIEHMTTVGKTTLADDGDANKKLIAKRDLENAHLNEVREISKGRQEKERRLTRPQRLQLASLRDDGITSFHTASYLARTSGVGSAEPKK